MGFIEKRAMSLEERAEVYKALGHPTRLQIFEKILLNSDKAIKEDIEICVSDIAAMFDFTLATISKHLEILKHAGLIKTHKEGKKIIIAIDIQRTKKISESLSSLITKYQEERKNTEL